MLLQISVIYITILLFQTSRRTGRQPLIWTVQGQMVGLFVTNKETTPYLPRGTDGNNEKNSGPTEVRTEHFLNTSLRRYHYTGPLGLCGCRTWSPTLREEYELQIFEKALLRKLFGCKKDESERMIWSIT
jgi:hypothetical protein